MYLENKLGVVVASDEMMICQKFGWKLLDESWDIWIEREESNCSSRVWTLTTDCPRPQWWTVRGYSLCMITAVMDVLYFAHIIEYHVSARSSVLSCSPHTQFSSLIQITEIGPWNLLLIRNWQIDYWVLHLQQVWAMEFSYLSYDCCFSCIVAATNCDCLFK